MENSNGADGTPADSVRRAASSAQDALSATKDAALHQIEEQGARVAGSLDSAVETLRRAANDIQGEHAFIGMALTKSADGLETASQSLAGGDINQALGQLNEFARRQPAVFLGASVALGFVLARVGKTAVENVADASTLAPATSPGW
ncbi:MAG: hypothetical protein WDM79_03805 [Terricaulis sp.]